MGRQVMWNVSEWSAALGRSRHALLRAAVMVVRMVPEAWGALRLCGGNGIEHALNFTCLARFDGHRDPVSAMRMHFDPAGKETHFNQPALRSFQRFRMGEFTSHVSHGLDPPHRLFKRNMTGFSRAGERPDSITWLFPSLWPERPEPKGPRLQGPGPSDCRTGSFVINGRVAADTSRRLASRLSTPIVASPETSSIAATPSPGHATDEIEKRT